MSFKVWKCLVFPGMLATPTFFFPKTALITLDFPTLGYPVNPIYSFPLTSANPFKAYTSWWGDRTSGELSEAGYSPSTQFYYLAVKKKWSIFLLLKYSFHLSLIAVSIKSLLLMISKNRVFPSYFAYATKSSQ